LKYINFILLSILFFSGCGNNSKNQNNIVNGIQVESNKTANITLPIDSNLFEYTQSSDPMSIGSIPYYQMSFLDSNLNFPTLNKAQQSDLDRFSRMQNIEEIQLHPVSKNWLRLSLIPKRTKDNTAFERQPIDINNAKNPMLFTLVDETNATIPIDKTDLRRRTIYAPLRVADLRIKESVFIHTNQDLEIGKSYHLSVDSNLTGSTIEIDVLFNPQNQISELLRLVLPYKSIRLGFASRS